MNVGHGKRVRQPRKFSPMIGTGKGFLPNVMKTVFKTGAQCAATFKLGGLWLEGQLRRSPSF